MISGRKVSDRRVITVCFCTRKKRFKSLKYIKLFLKKLIDLFIIPEKGLLRLKKI